MYYLIAGNVNILAAFKVSFYSTVLFLRNFLFHE